MTEILSQEEIDALLIAISTGNVDMVDYSVSKEKLKIKLYDFRRPTRFSQDQIYIMN